MHSSNNYQNIVYLTNLKETLSIICLCFPKQSLNVVYLRANFEFGYNNGKAQAIHGNDDCVLAYAIGNYICQQPTMAILPPGKIAKPVGL